MRALFLYLSLIILNYGISNNVNVYNPSKETYDSFLRKYEQNSCIMSIFKSVQRRCE